MWGLHRAILITILIAGFSIAFFALSIPTVSSGETHTFEVDIEPGEYQKIKLVEYDNRGDSLGITLARVVATGDTSIPRSLNYYILENHYAKQYSHAPEYLLQDKALVYKMNYTDKIYSKENLVCNVDAQMHIIIDNYWRSGDESGDANLTVKVKINYYVDPYIPDEGLPIMLIILLLIGLLVIVGVIIGIILWKKKEKEGALPFAIPEGQYTVYRGMDGSVYYLNRSQYDRMSNDGSILQYEYMGHADMIGGVPVMDSVQASSYHQDGLNLSMIAQPEGGASYPDQAYPSQGQMDQYQDDQVSGYYTPQPVEEGYDTTASSESVIQADPGIQATSDTYPREPSTTEPVPAPPQEAGAEGVGSDPTPVEAGPEVPPEGIVDQ